MKINKIERKKFRVSNKVKKVSSADRYRLSVNRSLKNISVQIIDDRNNRTLASASSYGKKIKMQKKNKKELSAIVADGIYCQLSRLSSKLIPRSLKDPLDWGPFAVNSQWNRPW